MARQERVRATGKTDAAAGRKPARRLAVRPDQVAARGAAAALDDARAAGLLGRGKTRHLSFRAPLALVEAAKRESGVASPTELGILALATLAQPDPVASFFKRTRGRLGKAHRLDY